MDYLLRCSIIFVTFYIIYTNFGVDAVNPIVKTKFDKVSRLQDQLNKPYENALPWQRKDPFTFLHDLDNYVFDDNNRGKVLEYSLQYSNENTQSVANDDYDEDKDDEALSSDEISSPSKYVEKRGRQHFDLCPLHERRYKLRGDWRQLRVWELHFNYTERVCNHTTTSHNYDRQYNRICDSIGKTFKHGHGTHCFQRFTSFNIKLRNRENGRKTHYTEDNFMNGCSCGGAINELGSIKEYHDGKILKCKDIRNCL